MKPSFKIVNKPIVLDPERIKAKMSVPSHIVKKTAKKQQKAPVLSKVNVISPKPVVNTISSPVKPKPLVRKFKIIPKDKPVPSPSVSVKPKPLVRKVKIIKKPAPCTEIELYDPVFQNAKKSKKIVSIIATVDQLENGQFVFEDSDVKIYSTLNIGSNNAYVLRQYLQYGYSQLVCDRCRLKQVECKCKPIDRNICLKCRNYLFDCPCNKCVNCGMNFCEPVCKNCKVCKKRDCICDQMQNLSQSDLNCCDICNLIDCTCYDETLVPQDVLEFVDDILNITEINVSAKNRNIFITFMMIVLDFTKNKIELCFEQITTFIKDNCQVDLNTHEELKNILNDIITEHMSQPNI